MQTTPYIASRRFREEPPTALEAIRWMREHNHIWYQAPMDHSPVRLSIGVVKTWKRDLNRFEVSAQSSGTIADPSLRFRIDNGHLVRIRIPYDLWHHGISARLHHERYVGQGRVMVVSQSNGFHHTMKSLSHAIAFAKSSAMELTVQTWINGKRKTRVLVPAHPPISGERNFPR